MFVVQQSENMGETIDYKILTSLLHTWERR